MRKPLIAFQTSAVLAAEYKFKESIFTFSHLEAGNSDVAEADFGGGLQVNFDCPHDKWCGMIVSEGVDCQVFEIGDTYILARHGVCDESCCQGLKENDYPDHSCPHPTCCTHEGPIGIRDFISVMGDGWSWKAHRGIGQAGGLRGDATYVAVDPDVETFIYADQIDGRNLANVTLPYGTSQPG